MSMKYARPSTRGLSGIGATFNAASPVPPVNPCSGGCGKVRSVVIQGEEAKQWLCYECRIASVDTFNASIPDDDARTRIGNTPTCGLCDTEHGQDEECPEPVAPEALTIAEQALTPDVAQATLTPGKLRTYNAYHSAPSSEAVKPNCPILVGHLNALLAKGGASATLARNLALILDDVEHIAGLIDHKYPAGRHAVSRAEHISECSVRLLSLIREIV